MKFNFFEKCLIIFYYIFSSQMLIFCFYHLSLLSNRPKFIISTVLFICFMLEYFLLEEKKKYFKIYKMILLFKLFQILVYSKKNYLCDNVNKLQQHSASPMGPMGSKQQQQQHYLSVINLPNRKLKSYFNNSTTTTDQFESSIKLGNSDQVTLLDTNFLKKDSNKHKVPRDASSKVLKPKKRKNLKKNLKTENDDTDFDNRNEDQNKKTKLMVNVLLENAHSLGFQDLTILILVFTSYIYHMIIYFQNNNKKILKFVLFITWLLLFTSNIDQFNLKQSYFVCSIQILFYTIVYIASFSYKKETQYELYFINLCKELVENAWFMFCENILFLIILFPIQLFVKFYLYRKLKSMMKKNRNIISAQSL